MGDLLCALFHSSGELSGLLGFTMSSRRPSSEANHVRSHLPISIFLCPKCERENGKFIHFRKGQAVSSEVDGLDICAARIAGLYAHTIESGCAVNAELFFA